MNFRYIILSTLLLESLKLSNLDIKKATSTNKTTHDLKTKRKDEGEKQNEQVKQNIFRHLKKPSLESFKPITRPNKDFLNSKKTHIGIGTIGKLKTKFKPKISIGKELDK